MKKTLAISSAILGLLTVAATASSPALIRDAGTNATYFASTANEPDTETGPVLNAPKAFSNGTTAN